MRGKSISQQIARSGIRQAAALEVEHFICFQLADRGAVRAFDVVGEDLQLRLGIDMGLVGNQQIARLLSGVGLLRAFAHQDLAVEHGVRCAADHGLVQLPAAAMCMRVVDAAVHVGQLPPADQCQTIDGEVGRFTSLSNGQILPGNTRAQRDVPGGIVPATRNPHCGVANVKRRQGFALQADMVNTGILCHDNLAHRVGQISAFGQTHKVFHYGALRAVFSDHQHARISCAVLARGDEQQMNGCTQNLLAHHMNQGAIVQKRGIHGGKSIVFNRCQLGQMRLRDTGTCSIGQIANRHTRVRLDLRQLRRIVPIHEHQPCSCFGNRQRIDSRLLNLACALRGPKRHAIQRRKISKAPVLVARGRNGEGIDTFQSVHAQGALPCVPRLRNGLAPLQQAVQIIVAAGYAHCGQAAALPLNSAATQS